MGASPFPRTFIANIALYWERPHFHHSFPFPFPHFLIAIFIYYIVVYFITLGRTNGLVYKKVDNSPIDLAVVRAISESSRKLVKTTVSDNKGRFALALPKGYYNIVATKADLQQEEIIKSRVKSNFSPTKAKIGLSEIDFEPSMDKQIPSAVQVSSSSIPTRTFGDSDEIINSYDQEINDRKR